MAANTVRNSAARRVTHAPPPSSIRASTLLGRRLHGKAVIDLT
ncbi:hypothetical protein ABGB18_37820 [Nonomuraea sp. B12E4]